MMNSDVIGGAFFSLSIPKSIVSKSTKPHDEDGTRDRSKLDASQKARCAPQKKKATAVKKATRVSKHGISIGKTKKKKKCGKRMTRPDF